MWVGVLRSRMGRQLVGLGILGLCLACGDAATSRTSAGGGIATVGADTEGTDTEGGVGKADDPGGGGGGPGMPGPGSQEKFDVGYDTDGEEPSAEDEPECATVTQSAQATPQPADIVFVIDNSGSMQVESAAVQANLNGFSTQIIQSGIDVRIVLLSSYPGSGYGMCIDPPLGSGGCPGMDTNPPAFLHVNQLINSTDGLSRVLSTHDAWSSMMRPDASKHIIMVTDDNSSLPAASFDSQFTALDPSYAEYKLHGIVSMQNCPQAARVGSVYIELGQLTGGLLTDLCDQDFQPVFDLLSTEVIEGAQLSCQYPIPAPPDGEAFDPSQVNVDFDDGGGLETIGYVADASHCGAVTDGWHYDDAADPTTIIACPQTCDRFQDLLDATIEIRFGCATVPAG